MERRGREERGEQKIGKGRGEESRGGWEGERRKEEGMRGVPPCLLLSDN